MEVEKNPAEVRKISAEVGKMQTQVRRHFTISRNLIFLWASSSFPSLQFIKGLIAEFKPNVILAALPELIYEQQLQPMD